MTAVQHDEQALLDVGLESLSGHHVTLGEVRVVDLREEWIEVRDHEVDSLTDTSSRGVGVRVLVDGAWGYAATNDLSPDAVRGCAEQAVAVARVGADRVNPARLDPLVPQVGEYHTPLERNYFDVGLDDKLSLLLGATKVLKGSANGSANPIVSAKAKMNGLERKTWFASTAGTRLTQTHSHCGAGLTATSAADGVVQVRSFPKSFEGNIRAGGWEYIESLALASEAERVREEALELLVAPVCPAGRRTLILDGAQLSLQIHESCGHPIELDRALGEEVSLAGCSFLRPERLNDLTYGSPLVNLYADSVSAGGPGTFGWDDEGVPAGRWDIVREGRFVGYLGSRETTTRVPGTVPGAMRSIDWSRPPIVRMVNINLAPGDATLEEMIADTEDGVLMSVNRSWSIDDFRLNFQFSCEAGWEIKRGKITRMVRNPVYTGITPQFWQGCDAIADENHWAMWGWRFCGKGDPMQLMHVGHGCSPTRFQDVEIGGGHAG